MPSIRKCLRGAAAVAALTTGTVVVAATPSSAADAIKLDTTIVRDIATIQPLPDIGDIVDVGELPSCDPSEVASYCMTVGGPVLGPLAVPSVEYDTIHLTDVVAYLDRYDVRVGQTGGEFLDCIAFVQPVAFDPCGALGFPRISHEALVAQPVDAYSPRPSDQPLTTVTACEAQITGTLDGRNFSAPALAVC